MRERETKREFVLRLALGITMVAPTARGDDGKNVSEEEEEEEEYVPVRKRRALEMESRRLRLKSIRDDVVVSTNDENENGVEIAIKTVENVPNTIAQDAVVAPVPAAATSLLLRQHHLSTINAGAQETAAEVALREEEELLKSIGNNKQALQSVQELAHSIKYTEPMKTLNWNAPKNILTKGKC